MQFMTSLMFSWALGHLSGDLCVRAVIVNIVIVSSLRIQLAKNTLTWTFCPSEFHKLRFKTRLIFINKLCMCIPKNCTSEYENII